MAIIIKEIHVKTIVDKKRDNIMLSQEELSLIKRSIIREMIDSGQMKVKKGRKDR
jgi:hypothetical protein